jgi:hypothetical protein
MSAGKGIIPVKHDFKMLGDEIDDEVWLMFLVMSMCDLHRGCR